MFSNKKLFFLGLFAIIFCFTAAGAVFAAYGLEETAVAAGLKTSVTLPVLVGNVIGTVLSLIGVIFFALMIYGGFLWMTAGGDVEDVKKAKAMLQQAIIGVAIILAAYAISEFVVSKLVSATLEAGTTAPTP